MGASQGTHTVSHSYKFATHLSDMVCTVFTVETLPVYPVYIISPVTNLSGLYDQEPEPTQSMLVEITQSDALHYIVF